LTETPFGQKGRKGKKKTRELYLKKFRADALQALKMDAFLPFCPMS
jgi:hypothetical protein